MFRSATRPGVLHGASAMSACVPVCPLYGVRLTGPHPFSNTREPSLSGLRTRSILPCRAR
jgi:hypothetical protein